MPAMSQRKNQQTTKRRADVVAAFPAVERERNNLGYPYALVHINNKSCRYNKLDILNN